MKNFLTVLIAGLLISCGGPSGQNAAQKPTFPKGSRQDLNYQTVSIILKDMKTYTEAVQKLNQAVLNSLDEGYQSVIFHTEQKPLFINVYPDAPGGQVIFLLAPKDPATGANYLFTFDKPLPVISDKTIELQIRTKDPEKPFNCMMKVPDPAAFMKEYQSHDIVARYELTKKFLQSGTYDFDALTVPSYRARGYAFITFDLKKAEVVDKTANLMATCTQ